MKTIIQNCTKGFEIVLHQENEVTGKKMVSKMNLIDLAGSERATVTDGYGNKRSRDVMDKRKRKSRNKSCTC